MHQQCLLGATLLSRESRPIQRTCRIRAAPSLPVTYSAMAPVSVCGLLQATLLSKCSNNAHGWSLAMAAFKGGTFFIPHLRDSFPIPSTTLISELHAPPLVMEFLKTNHKKCEAQPMETTMGFSECKISAYTKIQKPEICFLLLLANPSPSSPSSPTRNPLDYSLTQHWNP